MAYTMENDVGERAEVQMESIIIVLHLFSCFFSKASAGFPLSTGVHQTAGSSGLTLPSPLSYDLGTQIKRKSSKRYF